MVVAPGTIPVSPSSEGASGVPLEPPRRRLLLGAFIVEVSPALPLSPACRSISPAGFLGAPVLGVAPWVSPHRISPRRAPPGIPPPVGFRAGSSSEGLTRRPSTGCLRREPPRRSPARAPDESPPGLAPRSLPRRIPLGAVRDTTSPEHLPCRSSSELLTRAALQGVSRTASSSEVSSRGSPDGGSSRASPRRSHRYSPPPDPSTAAPSRRSHRGERPLEGFPRSLRSPLGMSFKGPPPGRFPVGGHPFRRLFGASIWG